MRIKFTSVTTIPSGNLTYFIHQEEQVATSDNQFNEQRFREIHSAHAHKGTLELAKYFLQAGTVTKVEVYHLGVPIMVFEAQA